MARPLPLSTGRGPARSACGQRLPINAGLPYHLPMRVLRTGIAGLLCAGLLAVAGCTGDPEQASTDLPPTQPPTSAPSPTAAPTTTPPPQPTAATAIALAVKTSTALNILYAKQDPAPLRAISDGCRTCEDFVAALVTKKRAGYHFSGSRVTAIGPPRYLGYKATSRSGDVIVPVSVTAFHVTDPHGRAYVNPSDPAGGGPAYAHARLTSILVWDGSRWTLRDFVFEVRS